MERIPTRKSWAAIGFATLILSILLKNRNLAAAFSVSVATRTLRGHFYSNQGKARPGLIQRRCQQRGQRLHRLHSDPNAQHDYTLEADSDPEINEACRLTEEQVHVLIATRLQCKKRRNFDDADKILDALNQNGIYTQDKMRKYRVDGKNRFGRRKRYVQRGGRRGLSSPEEMALVEEMVEDRARYKMMRDFRRSDELAILLKEKYGVRVDDRRREWTIARGADDGENPNNTECYVPTPLVPRDHSTHTMRDESKELIRNRLNDRSEARKNKNYKLADCIRDELMEEYSIFIDDRTKEWKVVAPEDSMHDVNDCDAFTQGALLSQRSAFVQNKREGFPVHDNKVQLDDESFTNGDAAVLGTEAKKTDAKDGLSSRLTIAELKEKLRAAGLPVSGRKSELIDRLLSSSS